MKAKRIAIVANSSWNIYNFRLNLIAKFLAEGHRVIVIAPVDAYVEYIRKYPEVKHILLRQLDRDNTNPVKDLKLLLELREIYRRLMPDVVIHYTHKPNIYGGLAARWAGVPSVAVVTGLGFPFIHDGITGTITGLLYKWVGRYHDKMIFENEDDRTLFIKERYVKPGKAYAVKGCGVDVTRFAPSRNNRKDGKIVFTFVGRLLYDKGILEFVHAARQFRARFPEVSFWVAGEIDRENPSMVQESMLLEWMENGDIVYHGFVQDIRPLISRSDCVVLPSLREGMPRTILEAMSMAKPVITTHTAGCRETVVHGENGWLVQPGNIPDLLKAFENIYQMGNEELQEMGRKGREMAIKDFNSEKIACALHDIILDV